ncbi:MAG: polysaccharide lyase family protein [Planctomycetota bacterium]
MLASLARRASPALVAALASHLVWSRAARAQDRPPVKLTSREGRLTLENGAIEMGLSPGGALVHLARKGGPNMLRGGGKGYWHANSNTFEGARRLPQKFVVLGGPHGVLRRSGDLVELAFRQEPTKLFPFRGALHYVLRRGESGFHLFMTIEHAPGMPAGFIEQYAYNLRLDRERFRYIAVDDRRRHVSHSCRDEARADKIMDATFRLAGGKVVSKYDYCHDIADDDYHVYGWAGKRSAVWLIQPSAECYPNTPHKQFLSSHQTAKTPIIIWQVHCIHFGGTRAVCEAGEAWRKLYGPAFYYVGTGASERAMWTDAGRRAEELRTKWPYAWMRHELFPIERGRVTGRLVFARGRPAEGAWVILSPPGPNWSVETKGYHFWARTDGQGRFAVERVRPGAYDLFAAGADRFEEYKRGKVVIRAGRATGLGTLEWEPASLGRRLWQIGTADRSPGEFRNGDDYRHWGLWRRYPTQFPDDVRFVIGRSSEREDWNFAHWNWHSSTPEWRIEFDMPGAPRGKAHLTLGIAAARPHGRAGTTDLRVLVNGKEVGAVRVPKSGAAGYRSGRQTTRYGVARVVFDAARLTDGTNTISLKHAETVKYRAGDPMGERGSGPGYIMYDAIRLELEEASR